MDSTNLVIVDNTHSSMQAVVPFLGMVSNPSNTLATLEKPMITDFFQSSKSLKEKISRRGK